MGMLRAELDFTSVDRIIRGGLHEYLDSLQVKMNAVGDGLLDDFFATAARSEPDGQGSARTDSCMRIRVALHHKTVYNYDRLVTLSPQIVRLRPAPHSRTPVTSYSLQHRAGEALHQLAAGSAEQFSGAPGLSGADAALLGRSRSGRRDDGHQSVRFLPGAVRRELSHSATSPG